MYNELILNENQSRQKILELEKEYQEQNFNSQEEINLLRNQLKNLQDQFEHISSEHVKTLEQIDQDKHEYQEEIQRLKRDFGLELYRKQDAEKKARVFEDKLRHEQTQYQKIQYDYTRTKHDLQTLQVKYDALQLEIIEIHQSTQIKPTQVIEMFVDRTSTTTTVNEEQPVIEPQKRILRAKRRTNDEVTKRLYYVSFLSLIRINLNKRLKNLNELYVIAQQQVPIKILLYRLNQQKRKQRYSHFLFHQKTNLCYLGG